MSIFSELIRFFFKLSRYISKLCCLSRNDINLIISKNYNCIYVSRSSKCILIIKNLFKALLISVSHKNNNKINNNILNIVLKKKFMTPFYVVFNRWSTIMFLYLPSYSFFHYFEQQKYIFDTFGRKNGIWHIG